MKGLAFVAGSVVVVLLGMEIAVLLFALSVPVILMGKFIDDIVLVLFSNIFTDIDCVTFPEDASDALLLMMTFNGIAGVDVTLVLILKVEVSAVKTVNASFLTEISLLSMTKCFVILCEYSLDTEGV